MAKINKPGFTLMVAVEPLVFNLDDGNEYHKGETFYVKTERAKDIPAWIAVPASQAETPETNKES